MTGRRRLPMNITSNFIIKCFELPYCMKVNNSPPPPFWFVHSCSKRVIIIFLFYELHKMLFCSKKIKVDSKWVIIFLFYENTILFVLQVVVLEVFGYYCNDLSIFAGSWTWSGHRHFVHRSFLCKSRGDILQLVTFPPFSKILGISYILASVSLL